MTAAIPYIFAAASAVSSFQQSDAQATKYRMEAQQAQLQGRQNALNYNLQANQIFERQQRLAGTIRARAVAGGVDPLTGSAMTVDQMNAVRAGKEIEITKENADMALAGGLAQSQSLYSAAETTDRMALFKAVGQAGSSYMMFSRNRTPSGTS